MTDFHLVVVFACCCAIDTCYGVGMFFVTGVAVFTHTSKWFTHLIEYVCAVRCGTHWFSLVESAERIATHSPSFHIHHRESDSMLKLKALRNAKDVTTGDEDLMKGEFSTSWE